MQTPKKIAIYGSRASYHDISAGLYFGQGNTDDYTLQILENESFKDLLDDVRLGRADAGLIAIDNSLAGVIIANLLALRESGLAISGEINLQIDLQLCALEGERMDSLQTVYSHPMAIKESRIFFSDYPSIILRDARDTASSAAEIAGQQLKRTGAISSRKAAELNGLKILASNIQDNKENCTRFLVVEKTAAEAQLDLKAALFCDWDTGSNAFAILNAAFEGITFIHSLPSPDKTSARNACYLETSVSGMKNFHHACAILRNNHLNFSVAGVFPKGKKVSEPNHC